MFVFECKSGNEHLLDVARSAVKRLKTLRHPSILAYLDSLEVRSRCSANVRVGNGHEEEVSLLFIVLSDRQNGVFGNRTGGAFVQSTGEKI